MKKSPLLVPLLSTVLLLAACSRPEVPQEPIRSVKLMTVHHGALQARSGYAGEIRARTESRLGFRVGGKLVQRPVEVGQRVAAGQLLAQLDAQDLALAAQAAQAQIAAAQTQRDLAAADFKRFSDLKTQGFVSGAEIERRQATLDAAEATLRQARAQGAVQGNQAGYARLLADGPGVVLSVEAEPGQVVAAGAPVMRLARDGARDAVIAVPEDRIARVRAGQAAQVVLWSGAGLAPAPLQAQVREVAASADPVTRTFQVKLSLPADAKVALGATVSVQFEGEPAAAGAAAAAGQIRLPTSALVRAPGGKDSAVWVFDPTGSTVSMRSVIVAGADGNEIVIVSGLKDGEEIVAAGVHVLSPGQKVVRFASTAVR
ncbi:efflux RND transporter periplasmic adaptor subunit [Hydrogenophaga sp. MI9]|uniref:efflux RND transporter periplasmic adaptor subunit n=1 Tax=Hydrogenophaga sp. MI9 TaxID=3453719 RepID=UPI003EF05235